MKKKKEKVKGSVVPNKWSLSYWFLRLFGKRCKKDGKKV